MRLRLWSFQPVGNQAGLRRLGSRLTSWSGEAFFSVYPSGLGMQFLLSVPWNRKQQVIQQYGCLPPSGTGMSEPQWKVNGNSPKWKVLCCVISQLCSQQRLESKSKFVPSQVSKLTLSTRTFSVLFFNLPTIYLGSVCLECSCDLVNICVSF